jgi:acyl dehydratase
MYFNVEYARRTRFERPLVNSALTLALVTGLTGSDVSRNGVNLGWKEVRFPNQMYVGDTLYTETEVLLVRESPSDPRRGLVKVRTRGIRQDGLVVMDSERNVLVWKRGQAPTTNIFPALREEPK